MIEIDTFYGRDFRGPACQCRNTYHSSLKTIMKLLLAAKNQWRARYLMIIVNSLLSMLVWE